MLGAHTVVDRYFIPLLFTSRAYHCFGGIDVLWLLIDISLHYYLHRARGTRLLIDISSPYYLRHARGARAKGFFSKEVSPVTPGNGGKRRARARKRGNFTAMTAFYRTSDQNQGYRGNSGNYPVITR